MSTNRIVLVTGGARSGKSRYAEKRIGELAPPPWLYLATAEPLDDEMRARIAHHRARRSDGWRTVEEPRHVSAVLAGADAPVLLDCVTLWLSNLLSLDDDQILTHADALTAAAERAAVPVVMVTNEVGGGIVPEHPLSRRFRDLSGFINQRIAAVAHEVVLVACGLPLRLK